MPGRPLGGDARQIRVTAIAAHKWKFSRQTIGGNPLFKLSRPERWESTLTQAKVPWKMADHERWSWKHPGEPLLDEFASKGGNMPSKCSIFTP